MKNNGGMYTKIYSSMFGKSNDQNNKSNFSNTTNNNKSYLGVQTDQSGSKSSRISTMYQKNLQKLKSSAAKSDLQSKSYNTKTVNRGSGFGNLNERSKIIKKSINKSLRPSQPGGDNHHNISMQTQQTDSKERFGGV